MRVAIDGTDEVAARTARVLFAEETVTHIGFMQPELKLLGPRTTAATDLDTYDVLVSTGETPAIDLLAEASVRGVPLVLWHDEPDLYRGPAAVPVVVSANMGSTLAPSLVNHPSAAITTSDAVTIAWTEPGKPYRGGTAITFPEPVGSIWARERTSGHLVARTSGNWGGAVVIVTGPSGERIVGVSDHGPHLEALTLAAVALVAAGGTYDSTICDASHHGRTVFARLMEMELDVAVWRSSP